MSFVDTPSQKAGRALIVVSGTLLAGVVSQISQRAGVPGALGSGEWWMAVLTAIFNPRGSGPIGWSLLALFGLGNALNLWGLWPELRSFRYSLGQLMAVVMLAALACFLLRFWPAVGLVLILMTAVSPAFIVKHMRRRVDRGRGRATRAPLHQPELQVATPSVPSSEADDG
jgi:hypothetical protein